jgi:hypothetical protein
VSFRARVRSRATDIALPRTPEILLKLTCATAEKRCKALFVLQVHVRKHDQGAPSSLCAASAAAPVITPYAPLLKEAPVLTDCCQLTQAP